MRREVLSDGLRVLTFERPDTPLVALKLFLKVGSRHDGAQPGISHFVEHMLFRRDWPGGDSAFRRIEAVGGEINAVTHREYTALQAVVLARDVARVFQAFREALAPLDLTGEGVAQERVILQHAQGIGTAVEKVSHHPAVIAPQPGKEKTCALFCFIKQIRSPERSGSS